MRTPISYLFTMLILVALLAPASLRADDEEGAAEPMNPQSLLNNLLKNQDGGAESHDEESHNTTALEEPPARGQRSQDLGDIIRVDGRGVRLMAIDQGDVVRVDATRGGGTAKECNGVVSIGRGGACHPNFER